MPTIPRLTTQLPLLWTSTKEFLRARKGDSNVKGFPLPPYRACWSLPLIPHHSCGGGEADFSRTIHLWG